MIPIWDSELVAIAVSATLCFVYLVVEPRLNSLWRFSANICISTSILLLGVASVVDFLGNGNFAFEPMGGGHVYTYILISAVYLVAFLKSYDGFFSFLSAALFVSLHEGLYFVFYYGYYPAQFLAPLTGDRAYVLWMVTIVGLYVLKKYPAGLNLWYACVVYVGFIVGVTIGFGLKAVDTNFNLELLGWSGLAFMFIVHLWRAKWVGFKHSRNFIVNVHH